MDAGRKWANGNGLLERAHPSAPSSLRQDCAQDSLAPTDPSTSLRTNGRGLIYARLRIDVAGAGPAAGLFLHTSACAPGLYGLPLAAVVLDESRVLDVEREEVERLLGAPTCPLERVLRVALTETGVGHVDGAAAELDLAFGALLVRDDGVEEAARVAQQVERFLRLVHHAEEEMALENSGFDGADARRAVAADSADEGEAGLLEPLLSQAGELRGGLGEGGPVHRGSSTTPEPVQRLKRSLAASPGRHSMTSWSPLRRYSMKAAPSMSRAKRWNGPSGRQPVASLRAWP